MPAAVVLLSGGLDSTTALAIARSQGFDCHALTVRYGQLHAVELDAARRVAAALGARQHQVLALDLAPLARSALTSADVAVPKDRSLAEIGAPGDVPSTYVPARNTVLLSLALAWAETLGARDIFLGVNVLDASGYPDCRPEFVRSFEQTAALALKRGVEGDPVAIRTPLLDLTKADIVRLGVELDAPLALTWSCYRGGDGPCGTCDSCVLRAKGFAEAGVADPALS
jgi:7-cyano-7-deazaguanine synthase